MAKRPPAFDRMACIDAALGRKPADDLFSHACLYDPFSCNWTDTDFAVSRGRIVGVGNGYRAKKTHDLRGRRVIPGLIDAHVHIESSLLVPSEYARVAAAHGTTTVIADPHEISNVCGKQGLEYMISEREGLPIDILFMLPSCVPATPLDAGGASLSAEDLGDYAGREGIIGLGEVMNVPAVLEKDHDMWEKLRLFSVIDGHAPLLNEHPLNAYLCAGIQSDHECTGPGEAVQKLRRGMYIFLREGTTEKNLSALLPLANPCTAPRLCYATDDRHADLLVKDGHIDDCIRKSLDMGLELETGLRMATLSPAERFMLPDRGALAPGRRADFCILDGGEPFSISTTYAGGRPVASFPRRAPRPLPSPMAAEVPRPAQLSINGEGTARVIGIVPGQILTRELLLWVDGTHVPDIDRDILKVVVCSRYRRGKAGVGLVHGFGLERGAIAGSVAHDAHNLVAVGADDDSIRRALASIITPGGGLAVVDSEGSEVLPLECAGLMSLLPAEEVAEKLGLLHERAKSLGAVPGAFMYLSFLSLTVIPHLRITERGVFDGETFRDVPLFLETAQGNR
ncbi:MAG: adenine deaminase [Methanolinea sp.]|nr:adenine deaminase [Methanolinea sp.]